jgi:hypothetical protein
MQIHKFVSRQSSRPGRKGFAVLAAMACAVAMAPSVATAQATPQLDARWQPWIGCWKPAPPQGEAISYSAARNSDVPLVCVIPSNAPSAPSGVDVVTVKDGKIVARDAISASGQSFASSKDGCNGVESASWSADGHRVYVRSDFTCPGGLKRSSSGIFAMSPDGEWVNVQGVDANGSKGVRTLRYADAGVPSALPEEIASAIRDHDMAVRTARAAAAAPLSTADVVEASHKVDSSVVEAWIVDRAQNFGVDAKQLVALADAGVPGNVTDAMVAVSYPKAFAVNPTGGADGVSSIETARGTPSVELDRSSRRGATVMMVPEYSTFYSPFDFYYGYSPYGYSPYGYAPYGYAPYGYSPYGYSPYSGYYSPYAGYRGLYGGLYAPPIIVLKGGAPPAPRGYVVKGRGYTQEAPRNDGSPGSTAQPRPTYSPPPSSQGSNSAPPPPPPSSGRTAHQRP